MSNQQSGLLPQPSVSSPPVDTLTNQRIELWKITVGTQQHFNSLQLQLRNFALTLFLAVLAAVGFAIKENLRVSLGSLNTSIGAFACFGGAAIVVAFYYVDWGYLRLLKGAVTQGAAIENALKGVLPESGLTAEITKASSAEKFLKIFPSSSSTRLASFYVFLLVGLAAAGLFAHFALPLASAPLPDAIKNVSQGNKSSGGIAGESSTSAMPPSPAASPAGATVLRHFVAFQFKDSVSPAEAAEVNTRLVALKDRIPGILAIERGTNNSPQKLAQGFTDGFLITFETAAQRNIYLTHPAHEDFLKLALPRIDKAFVFDYETAASGRR